MPKREMTSLDLFYLLKEIRPVLSGGKIQKIYQDGRDFRFRINTGENQEELFIGQKRMHLSSYKRESPQMPPSFCLFLRKHLQGRRINDIKQVNFDRVVQIETDDSFVIIELFSKGNVILTDKQRKIIMPLEVQNWKDRKVAPKENYKFPPSSYDIPKMTLTEWQRYMQKDRELVKTLASLGLGGTYAEEVCALLGADKNMIAGDMSKKQIEIAAEATRSLFNKEINPRIIIDEEEKIDVLPFETRIYSRNKKKTFDSFNNAVDNYFTEMEIEKKEEEVEKKVEKAEKRVEKKLEKQKEAIDKYEDLENEARRKANLIKKHYADISLIVKTINKAKDMGMTWEEIKSKAKQESDGEAGLIEDIQENNGLVVLDLDGTEIKIDFTTSIENNIDRIYKRAKFAKEKMKGAKKAVKKTKKEVEKVEDHVKKKVKKEQKEVKKKRKKKWYEKFRWFHTSDGFLCIGGKDADQNEALIKKYTDDDDVVLHAEIQGAPFIVIKTKDREVSPVAIREAGDFAAVYSSAWKKGYGTIDVYWIRPDQVSKDAPSGQYLSKGSFVIKGKKNYLKERELKISLGVKFDEIGPRVIAGPVQSINKNAKYFITVRPGYTSQGELSKNIKNRILGKSTPEDRGQIEQVNSEEFRQFLPPGNSDIVDGPSDTM